MRRRRALWVAMLAGVFLLNFEPGYLVRDALDADDASYFAQSAALGIDFDLEPSGLPDVAWTPIGTGLLAAPFVAAFGLLDRATAHPVIADHRRIQYSWAYFGFLFAANAWFLGGVLLFWLGARRLYPGLDLRWNMFVALSCGVVYYVLRRFTMSHAFEFGALAVLFWACANLHAALRDGRRIGGWTWLASACAAISVAIRIGNLNVLVYPQALLLAFTLFAPGERVANRRLLRALGAVTAATLVAVLPLVIASVQLYGRVYPTALDLYGRDVRGLGTSSAETLVTGLLRLVPNVVPLLFSSEFGLVYTNPVLVIGGIALLGFAARQAIRGDRLALASVPVFLAALGFSVAVVLWWRSTGSAYGYRYLFVLYPFGLIGLATLMRAMDLDPRPALRRAFHAVLATALVIAFSSQLLFQVSPRLSTQTTTNVFGLTHQYNARGYMVSVVREVARPGTWIRLAGQRTPGLLVAPIVLGTGLSARIPASDRERYRERYAGVPSVVYLQTMMLLAMWVAFGFMMAASSELLGVSAAAAQRSAE